MSSLEKLTQLFNEKRYQTILDQIEPLNINPANNPDLSNIVAAALFQLSKFDDCLLWCEGLAPAFGTNPNFISMYGALLRRFGRLDEAETLFRDALEVNSTDPALRNNFSNLLIDLQRFDEAEQILTDLVNEDPSYDDPKANLNRLAFQRTLNRSAKSADLTPQSPADSASYDSFDELFQDPLMAAFSDEELNYNNAELSSSLSGNSASNNLSLPSREINSEINEAIKLSRALLDVNPKQVLNDCRTLHHRLGVNSLVYALAGEAYIRLKLFADAESALQTAFSLGSKDASIPLNLANLTAMRGDQLLSIYWLNYVAAMQSDNAHLIAIKQTLFPNGLPDCSVTPFQYNPDQAAPGEFSNAK